RHERAHDHRAAGTKLNDGARSRTSRADASVVGVFLIAILSRVGVRVFERMLVPVVLVLLLLRSAVAVVARILLAFWGRHVASVHARHQEVPAATSIETGAASGSRCLAPSLLLRILVSPQDRVPLCCKAWLKPRAARKVVPTRCRRQTSDGRSTTQTRDTRTREQRRLIQLQASGAWTPSALRPVGALHACELGDALGVHATCSACSR